MGLVSGDGNSLLWASQLAPYVHSINGVGSMLRVERGAGGWSPPQTIAPENVEGRETFELMAASGDLSTVLFGGKAIEDEASLNLFESSLGGCCAKLAVGISHFAAGSSNDVASVSTDGSHAFFESQAQLLPEDKHGPINVNGVPATKQVYEWTQAGGLRLAGVDSEGHETSPCGARLAAGSLKSHDVSADGSRVFFTSPDTEQESSVDIPEECRRGPVFEGKKLFAPDLYVRENGSTTVDISRPPAGVPDYGASFVGAAADGSKVFFVSASQLTPDKATSSPDLYEYDVDTGVLRRLSVGPPGYDHADVSAAIVSADGSHVYFEATGQLVPGAGKTEQENIATATANLYMYASGRVSFIAVVGNGERAAFRSEWFPGEVSPLNSLVAAVTPDGSDLIFNSDSRLTAYDSAGHGEIYRYDAASSTISCVSCSPTGAPAEGVVYLHASPLFLEGDESGAPAEQVGGLSSDGSTVFFAATGQRLPAAVNSAEADRGELALQHREVLDVYEWHDGVLSLVSTGTSASSDQLIGASPSGSDVFFVTASQLVGQDGDHAYDIYDARAQGGFAAPATPLPCVSLATCRSMLATPPVPVAPASVSFSGPGNLTTVAESQAPPPPPKPLTNAQKLSKALKACKKDKSKTKRASCVAQAHKKYGPPHKAKRSASRGGRS